MKAATKSKIVDDLKEEVGESLRGVVISKDEYKVLYLRDDVDEVYSTEDLKTVFDEYRANQLTSAHLEDCWRAGKHLCTINVFDEVINYHFMGGERELIFAFDTGTDVTTTSLITTCEEILERYPPDTYNHDDD